MNLTIWVNFSKRRNSTKRPAGGDGVYNVALKEHTSLMKPTFIMNGTNIEATYCKWADRYYYINDIIFISNDYRELVCELDVLATFKTEIGNYTTLISRAASDQNYDVVDSIYPAKTIPITKRVQISNPGVFTTNFSEGTFLICTSGKHGMRVHVMSYHQADVAMAALFPQNTQTINAWVDSTFNTATMGGSASATQFVTFYRWLPLKFSTVAALCSSANEFYVGPWNMCDGVVLSGPIHYVSGTINYGLFSTSVTFPARDDAGSRGKWEYLAPFAQYSIYAPPFGLIPIDAAFLVSAGRSISFDLMVEFLGGNATLRLYYNLGQSGPKMQGLYTHNLACDLRQAGGGINYAGILGGAASAVAAYFKEDYVGMGASIASAASASIPQTTAVGGGGAGPTADMAENWYAYATYFDPIDENQAELGRPLAEVKQISSLSGFVQTADAKISIPGHVEEMVEINTMLNSGIFYE